MENLSFFGKTFKAGAKFSPHELTRTYMKQSYKMPALLFINNKGQQITELHGFMPPSTLESILSFFAEKAYTNKNRTPGKDRQKCCQWSCRQHGTQIANE